MSSILIFGGFALYHSDQKEADAALETALDNGINHSDVSPIYGQAGASSQVLNNWFWEETVAGRVLLALKKVLEASPDKMMSAFGGHFLVPGDVAHRHAG